jgi:glucan phosphoethanolaminetransferase (alkaline phosphatase superfamily)
MSLYRRALVLAARFSRTVLVACATLAILIGGDLVAGLVFEGIDPLYIPSYIVVYALFALSLSLSRGRWFRISGIVLLVLPQLLWIGTTAYTGDILRPEVVKFGFAQMSEAAGAMVGEFGVFVAPLVIAVLTFGALLASQEVLGARLRALRSIAGNVLFVLLVVFAVTRAATMTRYYVIYPTRYTPSVLGTVNSTMMALRGDFSAYTDSATPNADAYRYLDLGIPEEPVTVAVIMGEGISPLRMSLYGGRGIATTPRLDALAEAGGEYLLFPRLGFSGGTATLGSLPTFLNAVHDPRDVRGGGESLLKMARKNGFKAAYLSVQLIKELELGGGAGAADQVETEERWRERISEIRDDILLEHLDRVPPGAARQFLFFHQRVNHVPYRKNCPRGFDPDAVLGAQGDALQTNRRQREYDAGMVCYDRNLARLLGELRRRDGALYVFITADHNEFTGEHGLKGHLPPILETALVPMMLYTNRPDSEVAVQFKAEKWVSAFEMVRLVARSLGTGLRVSDYRPGTLYISKLLPFGRAGYLRAVERADGGFAVASYGPDGKLIGEEIVRLSEAAYRFQPPR